MVNRVITPSPTSFFIGLRYGEPLDSRIRQLGELMSYHRLCDWFEQHWSRSPQQLEPIVAAKLEEMRRAAHEGGWENIP